MPETHGIIYACQMDGAGGGRPIGWAEARRSAGEEGSAIWLHLDYAAEGTRNWLLEESGLEEVVAKALLAEETRPRAVAVGDGLLVHH